MDLSLEKLSSLELSLYDAMPNDLFFDELDEELESNGTFQKYKELHRNYLELLNSTFSKSSKLEALKRLIFLNWYSIIEPSSFTGIKDLDTEVIYNSYSILNDYLRDKEIDDELEWMLTFYASWEWAILGFSENKLSYLTSFVMAVDNSISGYPRHILPKGTMANRGQMGLYWTTMQVEIK